MTMKLCLGYLLMFMSAITVSGSLHAADLTPLLNPNPNP